MNQADLFSTVEDLWLDNDNGRDDYDVIVTLELPVPYGKLLAMRAADLFNGILVPRTGCPFTREEVLAQLRKIIDNYPRCFGNIKLPAK